MNDVKNQTIYPAYFLAITVLPTAAMTDYSLADCTEAQDEQKIEICSIFIKMLYFHQNWANSQSKNLVW